MPSALVGDSLWFTLIAAVIFERLLTSPDATSSTTVLEILALLRVRLANMSPGVISGLIVLCHGYLVVETGRLGNARARSAIGPPRVA